MRNLILVAALALASCGGNEQANNSAIAEGGGGSEVTAVNDTTAIDAATGAAANMAADVNYMFNEESANALDNNVSANQPAAKKPARTTPRPSEPAEAPVENSATETNSL